MSETERKLVKFDPYANYSKLWLTFVDAGRSCGYQIPGVLPPTLIVDDTKSNNKTRFMTAQLKSAVIPFYKDLKKLEVEGTPDYVRPLSGEVIFYPDSIRRFIGKEFGSVVDEWGILAMFAHTMFHEWMHWYHHSELINDILNDVLGAESNYIKYMLSLKQDVTLKNTSQKYTNKIVQNDEQLTEQRALQLLCAFYGDLAEKDYNDPSLDHKDKMLLNLLDYYLTEYKWQYGDFSTLCKRQPPRTQNTIINDIIKLHNDNCKEEGKTYFYIYDFTTTTQNSIKKKE